MKTSAAMNQPKDILQMIFYELFPPLSLPIRPPLYPNRYAIPYTSTRILSVITVCRSWYLAGLPTLFRDIQVVNSKRLRFLLRALNGPDFPSRFWVQSLEIHASAFIPLDEEFFEEHYVKPFEQISNICLNLKTLAFTTDVEEWTITPSLFQLPIGTQPSALTHLYISKLLSLVGLIDALDSVSHTLLSLTIADVNILKIGRIPIEFSALKPITFSHLRILAIQPWTELLKASIQGWKLLRLERFTLLRLSGWGLDYPICKAYFLKFGKQIKALEVYPGMCFIQEFGSMPWLWYRQLLKWVPALEHLVVHHDRKWTSRNTAYSHANVKWIDIWEEDLETRPLGSPLLDYTKMGYFIAPAPGESPTDPPTIVQFPALRGIRVFPKRLRDLGNLPFILPLSPTQGPEQVTFQPCNDPRPEIERENVGEDDDEDDDEDVGFGDYNDDFGSDDEIDSDEWYESDYDDKSDT